MLVCIRGTMGKKVGGKPKDPWEGKPFPICNIMFRIDTWRDFGDCLMMQEPAGRWVDVAWAGNEHKDLRALARSIALYEKGEE